MSNGSAPCVSSSSNNGAAYGCRGESCSPSPAADKDGVSRVAGHVEVVRVRAMIEKQPRDRDGVVDRRLVGEPRIRQIQDRRPASSAGTLSRGVRTLGEDALDFLTIAAHDGGGEVVAGDRRILGEDALRRAIVHPVVPL